MAPRATAATTSAPLHSAVDQDLGTVADRVDHRREHLQRGRGAVELAATVVGDHHGVRAVVHDHAGVIDVLDALDDQRPRPALPQPRQVRGVRLGSNIWLISSATVPSQEVREANTRGSVVSRLNHHHGCVAASRTVRRVSEGDRQAVADIAQPRPGDRHVHGQDQGLIAAACARSTSSLPAPRSRHTYNWNHLRAAGAAAATSSMEVVPRVDSA